MVTKNLVALFYWYMYILKRAPIFRAVMCGNNYLYIFIKLLHFFRPTVIEKCFRTV